MSTIVIDTNTFIAAGWHTHAHARRVFAAVARRRFQMAVTAEILAEYHDVEPPPRVRRKESRRFAGVDREIRDFS